MNSYPLTYIPSDRKTLSLQSILSKDWAMLLDSGTNNDHQGNEKTESYRRYDICVCEPSVRLTYKTKQLIILKDQQTKTISAQEPFPHMRKILAEYAKIAVENAEDLNQLTDLPFNGGWLGYISYDYGREKEVKSTKKTQQLQIPEIQMGLYQWAIISDHLEKTTNIINFGLTEEKWHSLRNVVTRLIEEDSTNNLEETNSISLEVKLDKPFKSNLNYQDYAFAFDKIQQYIRQGDCYQVNFAQRFSSQFSGSPLAIYSLLASKNNSPFSAYLNFTDQHIISLSPERFIESHLGKVVTQPIKGTLPRDPDPVKDQQLAIQLSNSKKDKAENLMIVDLLRNDLSKTASIGSVKVTELFGLYHFESVHHLISTVESKLDKAFDNFDLLATTLPGGSITGAPKIRAMQIIEELETESRGIYCGIIGYIDFKGNMDTNICIRTLIADKNDLYCWAGGGLVADSQLAAEYQETFDKLSKILPILNSTVKDDIDPSEKNAASH